jgi:hypothetical protein
MQMFKYMWRTAEKEEHWFLLRTVFDDRGVSQEYMQRIK